VLLAEMPRMLQNIVTDLVTSQPDMVVAGPPADYAALADVVARTQADAVVVARRDRAAPEEFRRLLFAQPRVKLITIAADGRRATLHELRPVTVALGEVSADELVDAIRAAVRGDTEAARGPRQRAEEDHGER
jgi:DNA-binding NarL/FixJ family response regulator